jgi:hypothetical protein
VKTYGHKTLADICVDQMQTLKQQDVRSKFDRATEYALRYGIPHIIGAEIKDKHALGKLLWRITDLEIVYSCILCIGVSGTFYNFHRLTGWKIYNSLCDDHDTRDRIQLLSKIIRKFWFQNAPQSFMAFLQYVVNENIEELSAKATALFMTRYKDLAYFESYDLEETWLTDRILTKHEVVDVDISPSEDFVICRYEFEGLELFSLSDFKPIWKIHDLQLSINSTARRSTVFHPFLNIIFPGQLDPVLNLEGNFESGPIGCEKIQTKFTCCCFSHDHCKMVTHYDKHLIVWNLRDNNKVVTLPCDSTVSSMLFSGNDRYLATTDKFSFKVYDTENSYNMISKVLGNDEDACLFSTFHVDSWYCVSGIFRNVVIVRNDLTNQPVEIKFWLSPRNERAMVGFQAVIENETPLWFHKVASRGNFFIFEDGSALFFRCYGYDLRIFKINELIKGCKLKQEYDKDCRLTESLGCNNRAIISVDGRYIYSSNPNIASSKTILSSTQPGKSWKLVKIGSTPAISVTNGVFCINVVSGSTPELWNADFTGRLFNFPQLVGTFRCISVTENLVACVMATEVRFFDVTEKKTIACTQLPKYNSDNFSRYENITENVIACGSQYHVVYTKGKNTSLLQKTNIVDLSEHMLVNLEPITKSIRNACFSPSGALLAFPGKNSIHILDISTYELRGNISLRYYTAQTLKFFDEEHLLCLGDIIRDLYIFLINVKSCEILTAITLGEGVSIFRDLDNCSFSVCRKTADIVVFDGDLQALKLFKVWLPHQRKK